MQPSVQSKQAIANGAAAKVTNEIQKDSKAVASIDQSRSKNYSDYLPGLNDLPLAQVGNGFSDSGQSRPTPELKGQTQLVLSHLDIPMKLRSKNNQATGVARLSAINETPGWIFSYVDGDPHLRAVIYESLRTEKLREQVKKLFSLMDSNEIYVTLKQITLVSPVPDCRKGDTQDILWAKAKITVVKTMYLAGPGCPTGGLMLPDKHWEIAKRRDSQKLTELTSSAAFIGPIRNKIPQG